MPLSVGISLKVNVALQDEKSFIKCNKGQRSVPINHDKYDTDNDFRVLLSPLLAIHRLQLAIQF